MHDDIPNMFKDTYGWFSAVALIMLAALKYGPKWLEVYSKTWSVNTANLITGLQRQVDTLMTENTRKEEVIRSMQRRERELRDEIATLRDKVRRLIESMEGNP